MNRSLRRPALAALTVLVAAALASVSAPAFAAGPGDTNVYIIGSKVQYAGDDNFNAGRDNTVGSNNGTAPPATALGTALFDSADLAVDF
ncbi:hypothetical protein ACIBJC_02460 [Streptomyces sp. NPDC050509]|uniref:hypothetical protein n=1 Tax=Streptomyces sp. NPDC050509 TaxID=3365620 RepID=UPI0037BC611D